MKLFNLAFLIFSALGFSALGQKSSYAIKYIRMGPEHLSGMGNYLRTNISRRNMKDTVSKSVPLNLFLDGVSPNNKGIFFDVCKLLKEGDSVEFAVPAENFYKVTQGMKDLPSGVTPESPVVITMGVIRIVPISEYVNDQLKKFDEKKSSMENHQDSLTVSDGVRIDQYLRDHKLIAKNTKSGVRYVVTDEGHGEPQKPGERISIHYTGTLLDGEKFDSSRDRNIPFTYRYKINQVIYGMDDGFSAGNIKVGTKLTLYIPSPLAYGKRKRSEVINPNSILVFDVEILDGKTNSGN